MAILIGILLVISIYMPLTVPITPGLFLVNGPGIIFGVVHLFRRTDLGVLAKICGVALVFTVLVSLLSDETASFERRILSGGQFPYTLLFSLMAAFSRPYSDTEKRTIVRILITTMAVLTTFAVLEPLVPGLSAISDLVRVEIYPEQLLYDGADRDILFAGRIRPKVFCSEPSHASWGLVLFGILVFALSKDRKPRVITMVVVLVSAVAFSSPAALVATAALMTVYLLESGKISVGSAITGLVVAGFVGVPLAIFGSDILTTRYSNQVSILDEGSTYVRLVQPFILAYEGIIYNPLFGVGFAGLESIWTKIDLIEGGSEAESLRMSAGATLLTIPLFSGLFGCGLFVVFVRFLVARIYQGRRLGFIIFFMFMFTQKSHFSNTTAWFVVGVYLAANPALAARARTKTGTRDRSSTPARLSGAGSDLGVART